MKQLWISLCLIGTAGWLPAVADLQDHPAEALCERPAPWTDLRFRQEAFDFVRNPNVSAEPPDDKLAQDVQEYWEAYATGDVETLLLFLIDLSDAHLEIEEERIKNVIQKGRPTYGHQILRYERDVHNPWHVAVTSAALQRISGQCMEVVAVSEWIRVGPGPDWFTLPAGQVSYSGAYKGRPNRNYFREFIPFTEEDRPLFWSETERLLQEIEH